MPPTNSTAALPLRNPDCSFTTGGTPATPAPTPIPAPVSAPVIPATPTVPAPPADESELRQRLGERLESSRPLSPEEILPARAPELERQAQIVLNHPQLYPPKTREDAEKLLAEARRQRAARTAPPAAPTLATWLATAQAAFQRGDLPATRNALGHAAALSPHDGDIREGLGCVLFQLGEIELAHREFSQANCLRPDRADTLVKLAMAAVRLDHLEEFEAALGRALELEPENRDGLKLLGDLNLDAGHYSQAAPAFRKLTQLHPRDVDSLLSLGLCYQKTGDPDAARACYEQALAVDPHNRAAQENLAALGGHTDTAAGAQALAAVPVAAAPPAASAAVAPARNPRISVILPTGNRPEILAQCLTGFAAQTLSPDQFEVVIVDDGSQPSVAEVVQRFAAQLWIQYHQQPNAGRAAARNQCIALATAPWLALHDDADVPAPDYLERCVAFHEAHPAETDILLAQVVPAPTLARTPLLEWMFDGRNGVLGFPAPGAWHRFDKFYGGTSSCKRSLFQHAKYDPEYRFDYEDMELALRLSQTLALRVEYHPEVVSQRVRGPEFAELFRRSYREGRSFRRCFEQHGEGAFVILSPELRNCGEFVSQLEPKLSGLLELVRKLEQPDGGDGATLTVEGRALKGAEALQTAYSFCARYARARGWLDFANRVAEAEGLERIGGALKAYRGADATGSRRREEADAPVDPPIRLLTSAATPEVLAGGRPHPWSAGGPPART